MSIQTVCDVTPCSRLLASLRRHFVLEELYDPAKGPLIAHVLRAGSGELDRLNFKYCPFCGTRLLRGTIETWADKLKLRIPKLPSAAQMH